MIIIVISLEFVATIGFDVFPLKLFLFIVLWWEQFVYLLIELRRLTDTNSATDILAIVFKPISLQMRTPFNWLIDLLNFLVVLHKIDVFILVFG